MTRDDRARYQHQHGFMRGPLKRPPPYNVTLVKGAVHVTLSRAFVNFTLHDPKAQHFVHWAKDTWVPDELVFSTLNYNPGVFGAPGSFTGKLKPYTYQCDTRWWPS